jgi:undecaprenyl-diphosphatase
MPIWLVAVILGCIEGVTEFLPVSSTGHLLLAEHWLPKQSQLFNVVIQCGAVLAVLGFFSERLQQITLHLNEPANRGYLGKLLVAFVITGIGGVWLKKAGWKLPHEVAPIAWATLLGGVAFLLVEEWLLDRPVKDEVSWQVAALVGGAQLLAVVFPGASRSGTTILVALLCGVSRRAATEFSFLLGIPTLLAAGGLEMLQALKSTPWRLIDWRTIGIGAAVAAVTAFIVVEWLLKYVQTRTFVVFGWYRIAVGVAILLLLD